MRPYRDPTKQSPRRRGDCFAARPSTAGRKSTALRSHCPDALSGGRRLAMTDSLEFQKLRRRLFISVIARRTLSPTTQSPMYRRIVSHGLDYTTHFQLVGETFLSAILVAINVPPQVTTAKRAERVGRRRGFTPVSPSAPLARWRCFRCASKCGSTARCP